MGLFDGMDSMFVGAFGDKDLLTWTPKGGGEPRTMSAIWNPRHIELEAEEGLAAYQTVSVAAHVSAAAVPGAAKGDGVSFRGAAYEVRKAVPDEKGMVALILQAPSAPRVPRPAVPRR
ncbi:hypothetical protein NON00_13100 [Roseomonas sp. GC11]|uniref:head-tail joining protein n=1 Tax=Roseomonas sp. GC11 TaxID=2950546 RepID=UPI00210C19E6|nr:hypothetical protein [Roseomonas sp. GC11]MCQ4160865.1 hypothetical protein [Roseomonas sp. GC11]